MSRACRKSKSWSQLHQGCAHGTGQAQEITRQTIIEKTMIFYCTLTLRLTCADPGCAREVVTTASAAVCQWKAAHTLDVSAPARNAYLPRGRRCGRFGHLVGRHGGRGQAQVSSAAAAVHHVERNGS